MQSAVHGAATEARELLRDVSRDGGAAGGLQVSGGLLLHDGRNGAVSLTSEAASTADEGAAEAASTADEVVAEAASTANEVVAAAFPAD